MELRITRIAKLNYPQLGVLSYNLNAPKFVTLELPWKDNQKQISCIPQGEYLAKKVVVRKGLTAGLEKAFLLEGVPNRSEILIHVANRVTELKGCIAIGKYSIAEDGSDCIMESKKAYLEFMQDLNNENEVLIKIWSIYGGIV